MRTFVSATILAAFLWGVVEPSQGQDRRTKAEIDELIERQGRTKPDWYDATTVDIPATLELKYLEKPPGGWQPQKVLGAYVWDVINTNPRRWREGVKLMHRVLGAAKDDPFTRERAMLQLGRMYHDLLEDYARSAFWYRRVGAENDPREYGRSAVVLAECYWRLGNRAMAVELLQRVPDSFAAAKLWADLGETDRAIAMAENEAEGIWAYEAHLIAADACRVASRYSEALTFYQKVIDLGESKERAAWVNRMRGRAQSAVQSIRLFDTLDVARVADGTYRAASLGYEAPVEVEVVTRAGKIESLKVVRHREKQFYSALTETPQKIVARQSVRGVDATSGATLTSEAIIHASAKALAQGVR